MHTFAQVTKHSRHDVATMDQKVWSSMTAVQIISSVGATVVALVAIVANLWTTRRTLGDRQEERLWTSRSELYVEIIRMVLTERDRYPADTLLVITDVDARDRDACDQQHGWADRRARVCAYATDMTRDRYEAWDDAVAAVAGLVQHSGVTGSRQPSDIRTAVPIAVDKMISTGDQVIEQIRAELGSGTARVPSTRRAAWRSHRQDHPLVVQ